MSLISAKFQVSLGVIFVLMSGGCQSSSSLAQEPESTIRVELSSSLTYLTPAIQACSLQSEGLHILLEEKPANEMGKTGADVSLRWGDTGIESDGLVYRLGSDRLVFTAHKNNPLESLSFDQAAQLSKGQFDTWKDVLDQFCPECPGQDAWEGLTVENWQYQTGEDIAIELQNIPGIDQIPALNRIWIAPNPTSLASAIAFNPAAVGWLPARWLNDDIKEIPLRMDNPGKLIFPVLALTPEEPEPRVSEWLSCLQSSYNN